MDILSIPALVKSGLLAFHLSGLVLGLGAATMLDLIIVRFVGSRTVTPEYWSVISLLSKAVTGGLVLLWISGTGLLTHYAFFSPTLLTNPKIWAKITIVGVLTLNGVFIHRVVLRLVRRQVGGPLFAGLTFFQRSCLLASGAVSGLSWWIPFGLGAFPQLNFAVGAETILLIYGLLLILAFVLASLIVRSVLHGLTAIPLPHAEYGNLVNRLSALKRVEEWVSTDTSGAHNEISYGWMARRHDRTWRNSRPLKSARTARAGWLRVALPAVLAFFVVCLAFVFRPMNQASSATDRPDVNAGFELASVVASPPLEQREADFGPVAPPEQRAADTPNWVASKYGPAQNITASQSGNESQFSRPTQAMQERDGERVAQRQAPPKSAFVGIWASDASACSARRLSSSDPPAIIREYGATAGEIVCTFEKIKFDGSSWRTVARCSNGRERWTSTVRLTVKNDRLTWTSQRGSETYQRCERAMTLTTAQPAKY